MMNEESSDLIAKSMRLPADVVDYVEEQPGDTFTSKFVALVRDIKDGEQRRTERLAYYERTIAANHKKLEDQNQKIYQISKVLLHLHKAVDEINNLPFT